MDILIVIYRAFIVIVLLIIAIIIVARFAASIRRMK